MTYTALGRAFISQDGRRLIVAEHSCRFHFDETAVSIPIPEALVETFRRLADAMDSETMPETATSS